MTKQAKKPRAYFHIDLETPNLKPWLGLAWQAGIVVTDGALRYLDQHGYEEPIHPDLWDKDTLDWAAKTYYPEFVADCMGGLKLSGVVQAHLARWFATVVGDWESRGYEVWLVANHLNFDVTILQVAVDACGMKFPVKYNHVLDLPSLMVGATATPGLAKTPSEILSGLGKTKDKVAHTALADALSQVETLRLLSIYLPL